jgi:hypothetical protein
MKKNKYLLSINTFMLLLIYLNIFLWCTEIIDDTPHNDKEIISYNMIFIIIIYTLIISILIVRNTIKILKGKLYNLLSEKFWLIPLLLVFIVLLFGKISIFFKLNISVLILTYIMHIFLTNNYNDKRISIND